MINQHHNPTFCVDTCKDVTLNQAVRDFRLIITPGLADVSELLEIGDYILVNEDTWQLFYVNHALNVETITYQHDVIIQSAIDFGLNSFLPLKEPLILANSSDNNQLEVNFKKQFAELLALKCVFNLGAAVGIGNSNRGHFLYSKSFGPCQAVFAHLNKDEWGLYHAKNCVIGKDLDKFVSLIKDDVKALFIVQKTANTQNYDKAPFLALNCHKVMPNIPIYVIEVDNYRNIVLTNRNVILGVTLQYGQEDKKNKTSIQTSSLTNLDINQFKSLTNCVRDALIHDDIDYEIKEDGSIAAQSFTVPSSLLIATVRQIEKKSGKKSNILGNSPDFYQKPTASDQEIIAKKCMNFICKNSSVADKNSKSKASSCNLM